MLHSQDAETLNKSLTVLKSGGHLVSISGPPDPAFAKEFGLNGMMKLLFSFLSRSVRKNTRRLGLHYTFLFMRAEGQQLAEITKLIEANVIKPVVDKVFPFEKTADALTYVETGRAKGKVVVSVVW